MLAVVVTVALLQPVAALLQPIATPPRASALRASRILACGNGAESPLLPFMEDLLGSEEATRRISMEAAVTKWWAQGVARKNADELADLLSARAASVQTAAVAAHERGEDLSLIHI